MSFGAALGAASPSARRATTTPSNPDRRKPRGSIRAHSSRPQNSAFASSSRTACQQWTRFCSRSTFCFTLERSLRIFAQHFAERSAGGFLLAERGERLAETHQRVRRTGGGFVFGRDGKEGLGGVAIVLSWNSAFAEPILRLRRQPVARIFSQEIAEASARRRARSPCAARNHSRDRIRPWACSPAAASAAMRPAWPAACWLHGRWHVRRHGAGPIGIDRRRRRQWTARRRCPRRCGNRREIERRAGLTRPGSRRRRLGDRRRRFRRGCAGSTERARYARRIGIKVGIEGIAAPAGRWRLARRRPAQPRRWRRGYWGGGGEYCCARWCGEYCAVGGGGEAWAEGGGEYCADGRARRSRQPPAAAAIPAQAADCDTAVARPCR